ncbi:type II secretion system F family protein [Zhaonella formicivorans]|uniref:type II secretion system F family protein n=1 Tax=Zhaonella formicivorans TaxID=2528593 RepID=UPI0010D4C02C|nr:type II secretion system F family protein [Zhaonella formicivorans]
MSKLVVVALVFCWTLCLIFLLQQYFSREQRVVAERLQNYLKNLDERPQRKAVLSWKAVFGLFGHLFAPKTYLSRISQELLKAGVMMRGEEFFTAVVLVISLLAIAGFIFTGDPVVSLLFAAVGLFWPKLMLGSLKAKRIKQLNYQLGDALLIMANSLRAGFGFLQAMDLVSKEMPAPIAAEFSRTLREIQLGSAVDAALLSMAERVGSEDLDLVVTAVLIQRQVGGNLAEVLDNISHTIRERIRIKGEIKTLTAQGKISGVVIGLLPVFLLFVLFLLNRDYVLVLFTNPLGLVLMGGGILSQAIGFSLIRKIVNIEV